MFVVTSRRSLAAHLSTFVRLKSVTDRDVCLQLYLNSRSYSIGVLRKKIDVAGS